MLFRSDWFGWILGTIEGGADIGPAAIGSQGDVLLPTSLPPSTFLEFDGGGVIGL